MYCRHSRIISQKKTMPGISSANAAMYGKTHLISALKNLATNAPFLLLGTGKLDELRKLIDIFQGQITPKTRLETTETQNKIVKHRQIMT